MRYYLRIFISKNDLLPVDPQPKNYFPKRRWERWSDEALREDETSGKGNILMEREAMYSKAGKRVIVGDSGLTAYVSENPLSEEDMDLDSFLNDMKVDWFDLRDFEYDYPRSTGFLPNGLADRIREEGGRYCEDALLEAQKALLRGSLDRKSCSDYIRRVSGIVRLLELFDMEESRPERLALLDRHLRLLALMEHRPLSFAERCGQGVRSVYEKSLNGALFG